MATLYEPEAVSRRSSPAAARKVQFVVTTSKHCNLRCSYCYEFPDLGDRTTMSSEQLERMYRSIADHYYRCDQPVVIEFDWHGGEPLLLGADFYWRTFDDQTKIFDDPKITIRNNVQTNLTVLNEPLVKLLYEGFDGVGVSIDLFSGLRVNAGGRDSQPAVLENMDRLHQAGVPFGCITVLSRRNRAHLRKIFRFFAEACISPRILPIHRGATDAQNDTDLLSEDEVLQAFVELFEMWVESPAPIIIEPIDTYARDLVAALSGRKPSYYDKGKWESIYIVNTDGNLYSYADLFDVPLSHGNLFDESMHAIVNGARHRRAIDAADARMRATCANCRHYGRACSGYPMAEESTHRLNPTPGGEGLTCTRERGLLDHIRRRLFELGVLSASGELNRESEYFQRFDPSLRIPR